MAIVKISQYINPVSGFFKYMLFDFEFMTAEQLDILYFANYGQKNPAPIVTLMLSSEPTQVELTSLAKMAESLYSVKWSKLKNIVKLQYEAIYNYNDQLTETIIDTGSNNVIEDLLSENVKLGSSTKDDTRTDNSSNATQKTLSSALDSTINDGIYGFNSEIDSNSDISKTVDAREDASGATSVNSGTQKNMGVGTESLTDTKNGDNSIITNTSNNKIRTSTHKGNIGNLTTQQLVKQEIELWEWNYMQMILKDTNDFLTLPIYLS